MPLKYQNEIDNLNLTSTCPCNPIMHDRVDCFRFSFDPIEHSNNFLPNVMFDRIASIPFNYARDPIKACLRCGASYFLTERQALAGWKGLPIHVQAKLGYTHLAAGFLTGRDGVMKPPTPNGHFTFYENEGTSLANQFSITSPLP